MGEFPESVPTQLHHENSVIEDIVAMLAPEQRSDDKQLPKNDLTEWAVLDEREQGIDNDRDESKTEKDLDDPVSYLPIMRHHLHEALWSLNMALGEVQARDLADSYRQGLTVPKESPLARQLERSHTTLSAYLGLLDEEDEGEESVPEDE